MPLKVVYHITKFMVIPIVTMDKADITTSGKWVSHLGLGLDDSLDG